MNVQMLLYLLLEIVAVLCIVLSWRLSREMKYKWSEADRRANEQLRSVLTSEQYGQLKANLCLQPLEEVPDADIVVMHKLMIEGDEESYLQTANRFSRLSSGTWYE